MIDKPDYVELKEADGSLKISDLQYVISSWFGLTSHKVRPMHKRFIMNATRPAFCNYEKVYKYTCTM